MKVLFFQLNNIKLSQIKGSQEKIGFFKVFITSLIIVVNLALLFFGVLVFGFPEYNISKMWKIIGGAGLVLYWFLFGSFMAGLSSVTGLSGVPTSRILKDLFRVGNKNRKEHP